MRKLFIALVVFAAASVAVIIVKPGLRTKWYFALDRAWTGHWPLPRGGSLITRLKPIIRPTAPAWVEVEPSVTMLLDPDDYVSAAILRTGHWESDDWAAMRAHIPPGGVFVDVGAHIGYYSLMAAKVVGPAGRVIAVEPNPPTVEQLRGNIAASGATVIHVQPVACADRESTLELYAAPRANTGQSSLSKANASQSGSAALYTVRARRLDDIIDDERVARVDMIKIDVEGAEMLVLKGAGRTLDRFRPPVLVELIEKQLRAMGTSAADVRAFFQSHGYAASRDLGMDTLFEWSDPAAR